MRIVLRLSLLTLTMTTVIFGWKYNSLEEKLWDLKREKGVIEGNLRFHKKWYALSGEDGYMWRHVEPLSTSRMCDDSIICKLVFLPVDIVTVPVCIMIGVGDWAANVQKNTQEQQRYEDKLQKIEEEIKKTDEDIKIKKLKQLHEESVQE